MSAAVLALVACQPSQRLAAARAPARPLPAVLRVSARDEGTGGPLPVRIVLRGVGATATPDLGPLHRADGAGPVRVAVRGEAAFALPAGRYRVAVSHGPAWTLVEQDVEVRAGAVAEVRARLRPAVRARGWVACDLHVHASPSYDSQVTLEDRVASLVAEGIDFATPTEHNVVGDYGPGVAALPPSLAGALAWVPAVEVSSDQRVSPLGHFNVFPYPADPTAPGGGPPPWQGVLPGEIFRAARTRDPSAIVQVNHPRMEPLLGYFTVFGLDTTTGVATRAGYAADFDAVEVFNGFDLGDLDRVERVLGDYMALLNLGARYVATGSSDSHAIAYQWAGYPRTYVDVGEEEAARRPVRSEAVLRALRAGRAFVTSGPLLWLSVDGHAPGESLLVDGARRVEVRVRVESAPWIPVRELSLWQRGQRVARIALPVGSAASRFETSLFVEVVPGDTLLATARGDAASLEVVLPWSRATPFAFTNPVRVERRGP